MAMLAAVFDESETSGQLLVVAGYISRTAQWRQFHQEWCEALIPEGLNPRTIPFHMSEFEARKQPHMKDRGEFLKAIGHWSDEKCQRVLSRLAEIVNSRAAVGIAIALVLPDFAKVQRGLRPRDRLSPYTFCVMRCFWQAVEWADAQGERESIAYIFEDGAGKKPQTEVEKAAAEIYAKSGWRDRYRMGGLVFRKKSECLELQAAYMGAWEGRRYCLGSAFQARTREGLRASLEALLHGLPHHSEYWNERELRRFSQHIRSRRASVWKPQVGAPGGESKGRPN